MRPSLRVAIAAVALGGGPLDAAPATVVMLPFENMSGAFAARDDVALLVASALGAKGYAVVRGEPVEAVLESGRVRHLDSLSAAARERLVAELGAARIVTGSIHAYADGTNPIVALHARMLREDGATVFWGALGLTADDTQGLLGLGRAASLQELAREAVRRLLRDLPKPLAAAEAEWRPRGKPLQLGAPRTYRGAVLEKNRVQRVCLLPLENVTPVREASRTVLLLLARQLSGSRAFDVVEPAALRAAMVAERVRSFRDMDPDALLRLGARVGTTRFVRGTVYSYRDASARGGRVAPQIALELSLVDVADGRVLWTSNHARGGDDYEFLLRRGALSNATTLADRVIGEMVAAFESAEPSKAPPPAGPPRPVLTTEPPKKEQAP